MILKGIITMKSNLVCNLLLVFVCPLFECMKYNIIFIKDV